MNRIFKPRTEWPAVKFWIFGFAAGGAIYASIFVDDHRIRLLIREFAIALCLVQLAAWFYDWRMKRKR